MEGAVEAEEGGGFEVGHSSSGGERLVGCWVVVVRYFVVGWVRGGGLSWAVERPCCMW